jgi:hypothetical protein
MDLNVEVVLLFVGLLVALSSRSTKKKDVINLVVFGWGMARETRI